MNKKNIPLLRLLLLSFILLSTRAYSQTPLNWSLVAGTTSTGLDPITNNVAANTVRFDNAIFHMALAPDNTVYLSLWFSYLADRRIIKKIDANGITNTVAGTGVSGNGGDGGLATAATINPGDAIIDANGNIYFINGNTSLRKVDGSTGIISTLYTTPSGQLGSLTFAPDGNIYIGYEAGSKIKKLNLSTLAVTDIAGTGTSGFSGDGGLAINATFVNARDIVVNSTGDIYFSEGGLRLRKIDMTTGIISTIAGTGSTGTLSNGMLASNILLGVTQNGLAIRNDELYFSTQNQGIWKIKTDGTIVKVVNHHSPFTSGIGQDIEIGSDGTIYCAYAGGEFKGYILKACDASISSQPLSTQTVCKNASATDLSVTVSLTSTYKWYVNTANNNTSGTLISGAVSSSYTPPTSSVGSLYYYCEVTNTCATIKSNTAQVTVEDFPTANAGNTVSLCNGANPTSYALSTASIGGSATTGTWTIISGGGTLSTTSPVSNPASVSYTPAANYAGNVVLQLEANSPSCGTATSLLTLNYKIPPTTPILSASSTTPNPGSTETLSIQSGSLNGATQWTWYNGSCGGAQIGTGTSINVTFCGGSYTYYARGTGGCATSNGDCGSISINVANTNSFYPQINEVTVNGNTTTKTQNPNSPSTFSYTNCGTQSTTIALTNANLNQGNTWAWYTGGCGTSSGGTLIGTGTTITVNPSTTTTYYVRGEGSNSCLTNISCNAVVITVDPAPVCQNGGTAVNCGCNCPNGYSGEHCENIAVAASTLDFDGSNDYVELSDPSSLLNFNITDDFSIEAWIKPLTPLNTNNGNNNFIVAKLTNTAKGYGLFTTGSEVVLAVSNDFTQNQLILVQSTGGTLLDGSWHHVAASYDGSLNASGVKLYIDGNLVSTQVMSNSLTSGMSINNTESAKIGGAPFGTFRGRMDEVRIWNKELTSTEISSRLNCEAGAMDNLVASYHFNEGLAGSNNNTPVLVNSLPDASGNNITGTLLNFALNGTTSNWQEHGTITSGVSCCLQPSTPNITIVGTPGCPGASFSLQVDPLANLNSATQWEWYTNTCGGTPIGTGSSITVSPTTSTTYYVRGNGGCVTNASCNSQSITISDTQNPTISPLSDINVIANHAGCTYSGTINVPVGTDNCASTVIVTGPVPAGPYPVGTTVVTWTANDGNGNTSTQTQNIIVAANPSSGSSTAVACDSYTWIENANTVYTTSGAKVAHFNNSIGCDSTHTLNLTINNSINTSETETACGSYTWSQNNTNYTQSGTYSVNTTTAQGCPENHVLNLTINPIPVVTTNNVTVCPGDAVTLTGSPAGGTFSVANPYTGPSTTFTYTYTTPAGCSATSAPATISVYNVAPPSPINITESGTSALVNWTPASNLTNFNLRYKLTSSSVWTTLNVSGNSTTLNGLTSCSNYELQMQTICPGGTNGNWSSVVTFSTSSKAPVNLQAAVLGTGATLSWTAVPGTGFYGIRYRRTNPIGAWITSTSNAANKLISGLPRNACYEYQVQSFCPGATVGSAWSSVRTFCTAGAAPIKPGVGSTEESTSLTIYPNPVNTVLNIDLSNSPSKKIEIKLFDLSGRLVKSGIMNGLEEKHHMEFDVRHFVTGMYVVRVYEDDVLTNVSKVLIQP